ncbi:TetR/AcrR family transcriptional regulator [Nocardioides sp.]|uniref:TetR/AcrR family transcriptional regulator n=1 Tax=Nocardioides sp. TaxID=35761 RepID=UPI0025ECC62B|nr:TetR/AcrR family transcriptional regulator [Nocardioides sp.]
MTPPPSAARVRRSPVDRYDERREQLAESALKTLGELGYARTSLRDIATNSPFSHGVLHYYFDDKLDLIDYCIRYYKAKCVTRYDAVIADSTGPDELREAFAAKLVETIVEEGPMHRLWYDIRAQSMFEHRLRPAVTYVDQTLEDMVWRVIDRYAELSSATPALSPAAAYGMLDGLFHAALLGEALGEDDALPTLVDQVHGLLPLTIEGGTP